MTVPVSTLFELTRHCNLNCVHCYIVDNRSRGEVSTDEVIGILEQLAGLGVLFLTLSGGEVLLRADWLLIAQTAKRLGFSLNLFTNATLITPLVAEQIASVGVRKVEVSLHGSRETTVDAITQVRGSYRRILEGIRLLRQHGVRVQVKANLLHANVGETREFAEQAHRLGATMRGVAPFLIPGLDDDPAPLQHMVPREAMQAYFQHEYERLSDEGLRAALNHPCKSNERVCAIGAAEWVVSADAYLYPCFNWRVRGFNLGAKIGQQSQHIGETHISRSGAMENQRERFDVFALHDFDSI